MIAKVYTYFRRGWGLVAAPIGAFNFLLISYRLLVEQVSFLRSVFPSLTVYALVMVPLGFVAAVFLGYWDYRHGTAPQESERIARFSPWHRSIVRSLYLIADGRHEDAKQELERWL